LKRRIWIIWAATAVLSVLAFVPIVVIRATFILFVPAIVLACAPNLEVKMKEPSDDRRCSAES
jgi:hypothetical protein